MLVSLGRRTITGLLVAEGQQFVDWSAAYRLFSKARFDPDGLFAVARRTVVGHLAEEQPLVAVLDDTLLRKRGRKVAGTSWHRDPLGPKFRTQFVWSQRFLQVSAALPEGPGPSRARAVPIDLVHCPTPRKPRKKAPEEEWATYRQQVEASRISVKAAERVAHLRAALDAEGQAQRDLVISADGSFTNEAMLRHLPARTALIGRVRKDARLFALPPDAPPKRGRRPYYGAPLPTPAEYRKDPTVPWQHEKAFLAGQVVDIEFKVIEPVRWRAAGPQNLRLVIMRPLAYRPVKKHPLLYRDPIYLLCTDLAMPLLQLVQAYLWRWEIELGFREQKTLLGSGEAQVRTPAAVERVPALVAVAYAFLHLSFANTKGEDQPGEQLPQPRWQRQTPGRRLSTQQAVNLLRAELWGLALGLANKTDFAKTHATRAKSGHFLEHPASAVLYATR